MKLPPTEIMLEALQETVGPPFLIGVVVLALARLFGKSSAPTASIIAFILSLIAGFYLAKILPSCEPTDKRLSWIPWIALLGSLAGLFLHFKVPAIGYSIWTFAVVMATIRILPKDHLTTQLWHAVPMLVLAFVVTNGVIGFGLMKLSERRPGYTVPFILGSALLAGGTVVIHAHTKSLLDVLTIGGMCLFGITAVVMLTGGNAGPVMPGAMLLLSTAMIAGQYETFSEVPLKAFIIPILAPVLALLGLIPQVDRANRFVRFGIGVLPVLLALGYAVGLAMANETLTFGKEEW